MLLVVSLLFCPIGSVSAKHVTAASLGLQTVASLREICIRDFEKCQFYMEAHDSAATHARATAEYLLENGVISGDISKLKGYCFYDDGITHKEVHQVFVKWADNHPEKLRDEAGLSLMEALTAAYPCH